MAALTLDLIKHNGPTPADVTAPQIIDTLSNMDSVPLHSSSRLQTLISKWKAKFTFIWKKDFGPLSNSPVLFLLGPGKTLLTMFLFQKWLGSPFPEDVWAWWLLMHWLQLQFTPCEALPSVWISFAWQYCQACGHPCCLCTFSYPSSSFQSTFRLICFDKALLEQPPLSVMTLCDLPSLWKVSMIIFWTRGGGGERNTKSAVISIIVVSKNKIPRIYTVWMVIYWNSKCKYSNILRYWFLTFISCKV